MTSTPYVHPRTSVPRMVVPAWAWAVTLLALLALYLVAQDNGVALAASGEVAHEFFHDARHSLGMPCH